MQPSDLCAVVCHSDLECTGWFECSDPLINRLHENVIWSMRGNFFDIPYGLIEAGWQIEGSTLTIHASIPHGTTATVHLPGATEPFIIGPGQYQWQQPYLPPQPAKPLTLDSDMAEVVDRQTQFNAIIAYLHEKNYITAGTLVERMAGRDDITLRQALALLPTAGSVSDELEVLLTKNSNPSPIALLAPLLLI